MRLSVAPRRHPSLRRACRVLALAVCAGAPTAACYTSQPLLGMPDSGTPVSLTLSDRGRVAMADSLGGAGIQRVEGRVLSRTDDSTFVVGVSRVRFLGGAETTWNGEQVSFRTSSVAIAERRVLNRGRSTALIVGSLAAVTALVLGLSLNGSGTGLDGGGSTPPPQGS